MGERLGGNVRGTVPCEQPPGGERRSARGTALERDASYEEALYERRRFVYPLVFEPLLVLINGEFGTVALCFQVLSL